jgi:acetyl-CoA/propionyl-CoA carboxylase biotin carboxyl carrier protein
MLAKLIVTGRDRQQALERSRRALAEFEVEGMPTVIPFHRAVVADPAFAPADPHEAFSVHTRWIETEFNNTIPAYAGGPASLPEAEERQKLVVEVGGKRIEVSLPGGLSLGGGTGGSGGGATRKAAPKRSGAAKSGAAASGDSVTAPMQGTIVKVAVEEGQTVESGAIVVVLEAMKMEQPITAHKAGVITSPAARCSPRSRTPKADAHGGLLLRQPGHPRGGRADRCARLSAPARRRVCTSSRALGAGGG